MWLGSRDCFYVWGVLVLLVHHFWLVWLQGAVGLVKQGFIAGLQGQWGCCFWEPGLIMLFG